jgi:hypothetical protein
MMDDSLGITPNILEEKKRTKMGPKNKLALHFFENKPTDQIKMSTRLKGQKP